MFSQPTDKVNEECVVIYFSEAANLREDSSSSLPVLTERKCLLDFRVSENILHVPFGVLNHKSEADVSYEEDFGLNLIVAARPVHSFSFPYCSVL